MKMQRTLNRNGAAPSHLGYRWCSGSRLRDVIWSVGYERCLRHGGSYWPFESAADPIRCWWWRAWMDQDVPCGPHPAAGSRCCIWLSSICRLDFGFPQGSVLDPLLLLLYTVELLEVINRKVLVAHSYAGASQFTSLRITGRSSAVLGVHRGDRRLDAVKQTQNEHRQNPADLDRNAPAAVKGRHQ